MHIDKALDYSTRKAFIKFRASPTPLFCNFCCSEERYGERQKPRSVG